MQSRTKFNTLCAVCQDACFSQFESLGTVLFDSLSQKEPSLLTQRTGHCTFTMQYPVCLFTTIRSYFFSAAWAAASLAMGTRNGEQET